MHIEAFIVQHPFTIHKHREPVMLSNTVLAAVLTLNRSSTLSIINVTILLMSPAAICNSLADILRGISRCGANSVPRLSEVILFVGSNATLWSSISRRWSRKRFLVGSSCSSSCNVCSCLLSSLISEMVSLLGVSEILIDILANSYTGRISIDVPYIVNSKFD